MIKPKNTCELCGADIYDNVMGPPVRVTCGDCVQRRMFYFSAEGAALGRAVIEARKQKGWSQRTFALAMECSQQLVDMIEKGERKPTPKMRQFLLDNPTTSPAETVSAVSDGK